MIKNILIFIFIALGMIVILNFSDHNLKRAVDACLAGSQKLSESKITDLEEAKRFCEEQIKKNKTGNSIKGWTWSLIMVLIFLGIVGWNN